MRFELTFLISLKMTVCLANLQRSNGLGGFFCSRVAGSSVVSRALPLPRWNVGDRPLAVGPPLAVTVTSGVLGRRGRGPFHVRLCGDVFAVQNFVGLSNAVLDRKEKFLKEQGPPQQLSICELCRVQSGKGPVVGPQCESPFLQIVAVLLNHPHHD